MNMWWCFVLTLSLWFMNAMSKSIITTLPGFPGALPFILETGYVGVGEFDEVQLFYYFIESQRSPKDDPLILWLTGGPGCSGLSGLLYEIGPFTFDYEKSSGNKPVLRLNPFSWTKVANIIFVDSPVGTGFSYAKAPQAYYMDDILNAAQDYTFLRKWLMDHPDFINNQLYVSGDSYSGMIAPIVTQHIYDGNEAEHEPPLNIQGYVLGNSATDPLKDENERLPYAHRLALISDNLYESTKENCKGRYVDADPNNAACMTDLQRVYECTSRINPAQILEPSCDALSPRPNLLRWGPNTLPEDPDPPLIHTIPEPWCRSYNYLYSYVWANDRTVQEALHVRPGTKEEWVRCNKTLSETAYNYNVQSSFNYHKNLTKKRCRALIYSGDHDMVIPYLGTLKWINALNLTISDGWQPWLVDGQVGGYTEKYTKSSYLLTFATVKGGGHTAPEYRPKECLAMIGRWLAHFHL